MLYYTDVVVLDRLSFALLSYVFSFNTHIHRTKHHCDTRALYSITFCLLIKMRPKKRVRVDAR